MFLLFIGIIFIILDYYTFQAFKLFFKANFFSYIYWFITLLILGILVYLYLNTSRSPKDTFKVQTILALLIVFYLPKIFILIPLLIEDILRSFSWITTKFSTEYTFYSSRRKTVALLGLGLASIPFLSSIYGIFKGRFNFKLHNFTFEIEELPESFEGFKIIQISDIHIGSFTQSQINELEKGIAILNNQKADLILFTGDMVNFVADEILPFLDTFKKINGEQKYSVFGNHDYGEYFFDRNKPDFHQKCQENLNKIVEYQKQMGFVNLRNSAVKIYKGNKFINLIGVENWGKKGRFPQTGDLDLATSNVEDGEINILMSHDPTHFDKVVKYFHKHIHLTLSGHTHGMQLGVELPFLKFSPVQFVYKKWAGLYEDLGKFLYVNRGFGFLALPARIGIFPEITLITLKKK